MGMKGLTVWGEPSDYNGATEISYLAFARFGWNPELTWDDFVARDVAPLFGGAQAAQRFIAITEEIDAEARLSPQRLEELMEEVVRALSKSAPEPRRRWLSLADRIGRRQHMGH